MNNLDFAIQMELDGEKYYREQADQNSDNGLNLVFLMMAEDEANHARILSEKFNSGKYTLSRNETLEKSLAIFSSDRDEIVELRQIPKQLNVYKEALENEKLSIDLYKKMFAEAKEDESREFFEFLIKEEMDHHNVLEEMMLLVNRTEEWVESAEFGVRGEY